MKRLFLICILVVFGIGSMAFNAAAVPINGAISFSGTSGLNDLNDLRDATAFLSFDTITVSTTGGTGDYSPVVSGTPVTFTPFSFRPALISNPLVPLWTLAIGDTIYSFDATGLTINSSTIGTISMMGTGIAHITGFEDTPGTWNISANRAGGTASFSGSTEASAPVPEPATMLLLVTGLMGLAAFSRKKFKK